MTSIVAGTGAHRFRKSPQTSAKAWVKMPLVVHSLDQIGQPPRRARSHPSGTTAKKKTKVRVSTAEALLPKMTMESPCDVALPAKTREAAPLRD
jgi:hypothetical protein